MFFLTLIPLYTLTQLPVSKETTHKPSKVAAVDVIDTTCFAECFLFYLITGSHCFL